MYESASSFKFTKLLVTVVSAEILFGVKKLAIFSSTSAFYEEFANLFVHEGAFFF